MKPRYPIYIPSVGRWQSRYTSRTLDKMKVPYRLVIQEREYDQYAAVVDPSKILVLPPESTALPGDGGLVKARNFIMEHSIAEGHKRHWQIDDNIKCFVRWNRNVQAPDATGTIFRVAEDFTERFSNIGQSGFNYYMFIPRKQGHKFPPLYLNTRIYSCTLNNNEMPHRYRGIWNDDTDMSLQVLKSGLCTILFNAFLAYKEATMVVKGGNTEYYKEEGRLKMSRELMAAHPDVTKIIYRFGRWHHSVDYRIFKKNKLLLKPETKYHRGVDESGMYLERLLDGRWTKIDYPDRKELMG